MKGGNTFSRRDGGGGGGGVDFPCGASRLKIRLSQEGSFTNDSLAGSSGVRRKACRVPQGPPSGDGAILEAWRWRHWPRVQAALDPEQTRPPRSRRKLPVCVPPSTRPPLVRSEDRQRGHP